jgi:uncharacterized Zn finger protein (UPF0148 family)
MTTPAAWSTDDPCPGCGTVLVLADDGGVLTVECRSCGTADTWTTTPPAGGDR